MSEGSETQSAGRRRRRRPPAARRRWRWVAGLVVAAAILPGAGAVWLLGSESGARAVVALALDRLPGAASVGTLRGSLGGQLVLADVRWELPNGAGLRAGSVGVDWRPLALLEGRWQLGRVEVEALRIRPPDGEPGEAGEPADWNALLAAAAAWPLDVSDLTVAPLEVLLEDGLLRLERVAFSGGSRIGRIEVRRLEIEHALGRSRVAGSLAPRREPPVDLRLEWSAEPPTGPRWAGAGTAVGSLDELTLRQSFNAPAPLQLAGTLTAPLDAPEIDLRIELPPGDVSRLWPGLPAWRAGGRVELRAQTDGFVSGEADLRVQESPWGGGSVEARVRRTAPDVWSVERLEVRAAAGASARAEGVVQASPGSLPRVAARVEWSGLGWPLSRADSSGKAPRVPDSSGAGRLWAGPGGLRLTVLEGRWLDGDWRGQASVTWKPELAARFRLAARSVSPESIPGGLSGSLAGDLTGRIARSGAGWTASLRAARVEGHLDGRRVRASAAVDSDGQTAVLRHLRARWGGAELTADGRVDDAWDVGWRARVADLGAWVDGAAGSADLSGGIRGPRELPDLSVRGEARAIAWAGMAARRVVLNASTDTAAPGRVSAALRLVGLKARGLGGRPVGAELTLEGDLQHQSLSLRAGAGERSAELAVAGAFADPPTSWLALGGTRWSGTVERMELQDETIGHWRLADAADLTAEAAGISLERICLHSGAERLCGQGEWSFGDRSWKARLDAREIDLGRGREFWLRGLAASGSASASATAAGVGADPRRVALELELSPGAVRWDASDVSTGVEHRGGTVRVSAGGDGLRAQARLGFGQLGELEAGLEVAEPPQGGGILDRLGSREVQGEARFRITSLRPFGPFVDALEALDGRLGGRISVRGSWRELRPSGRLELREGQARVPALGVSLEQVSLTARSAGADRIELEGSARSGEGGLRVRGGARIGRTGSPSLSMRLTGEGATVVERAMMTVRADPDLELQVDPQRIEVSGTVRIPDAELRLDEGKGPPVEPSPDVVIVRGERIAPEPSRGMPQQLEAELKLVLGDAVAVRGMGLSGRLEGELAVEQRPGMPQPAGDGEIRIEDGQYSAYGRELTLRRGRVQFLGGPIDDPTLDVIAAREAKDGTLAGVRVVGRVSSPEISLWSQPQMPDEEALSYLLFGRPAEEGMTAAEGGVFERAATSLGLGGGSALIRRIGEPLGLDKARIEPGGTLQDAALVLGKYLSPRLYVAYGVGLFEAVNSFRLRYMLSPQWTLEAESGEQTEGDLLYVIERPKR